jgi:hypothetical protein
MLVTLFNRAGLYMRQSVARRTGPKRFKLKKNRIILARRTLSEEDNANAQVSALLFGCLSYAKTPRSYSIPLICGCCRAIVIYCIYSYILHRRKVGLY